MSEVTEKKCTKCGIVKPAEDFNKSKKSRDGLQWNCKSCRRVWRLEQRNKEKTSPDEKRCSACKIIKPRRAFYRNSLSSDGLRSWCIDCEKVYNRIVKKHCYKAKDRERKSRIGIDSWEQVDSALRQMAEIQLAVNHESERRDNILATIKDYDEKISVMVYQQGFIRSLIEAFLHRVCPKQTETKKRFRFGSISFFRNKLEVFLNLEYARVRIELP